MYRAWRDYLSRCLDGSRGTADAYYLLHTASLVGLFSCIFVRSTQQGRVRGVAAAEVKTGMGGLYGNKASTTALNVRGGAVADQARLGSVDCADDD